MANRLHITNGDSTGALIQQSAVQGDVLVWRDPMHHGPFPAGLGLDALADVRAKYFASSDLEFKQISLEFQSRNAKLSSVSRYEEVVLWFEHDLLDQLQLLELLNWFGKAQPVTNRLTMICINTFPGVDTFRGLGQLDSNQLATLFPRRNSVSDEQLQLAATAWSAFRAKDPESLQDLAGRSLTALPYLKDALKRHLQDFPWSRDGLTRSERQILSLVALGIDKPDALFVENMNLEDALYIGDWFTYRIVARLCQLPTPLLKCVPDRIFRYPPVDDLSSASFKAQTILLTTAGQAVISGRHSALPLIPRDEWLGGVYLKSGVNVWLWSESGMKKVMH